MVTAQEEMIQRIDHDLDDTLDNTKKAQDGAFRSQKALRTSLQDIYITYIQKEQQLELVCSGCLLLRRSGRHYQDQSRGLRPCQETWQDNLLQYFHYISSNRTRLRAFSAKQWPHRFVEYAQRFRRSGTTCSRLFSKVFVLLMGMRLCMQHACKRMCYVDATKSSPAPEGPS